MSANQQTVEQRLAEFTEVHGTVLLGMHRELQSQLKKVDDRLAAAARSLDTTVERSRIDLTKRGKEVDAKYKAIAVELQGAAATSLDREANLHQAVKTHSDRVEDLVRKSVELTEGAQRATSELVERAREETGSLIKSAMDAMDRYQQDAVEAFKESHAAFSRQVESAEARITTYMVKQQQLLEQQARQIESLHGTAKQILDETNAKIKAHQRREAEFNRWLRLTSVMLVVIGLIVVVVGTWKPWTS